MKLGNVKFTNDTQRDNPLLKEAATICKKYNVAVCSITVVEPDGSEVHTVIYNKPKQKKLADRIINFVDTFIAWTELKKEI